MQTEIASEKYVLLTSPQDMMPQTVLALDGKLKLRMILDRYSVEVFINDGEQVMTATMYTDQNADQISFYAEGKVKMNIVKYDLV